MKKFFPIFSGGHRPPGAETPPAKTFMQSS